MGLINSTARTLRPMRPPGYQQVPRRVLVNVLQPSARHLPPGWLLVQLPTGKRNYIRPQSIRVMSIRILANRTGSVVDPSTATIPNKRRKIDDIPASASQRHPSVRENKSRIARNQMESSIPREAQRQHPGFYTNDPATKRSFLVQCSIFFTK